MSRYLKNYGNGMAEYIKNNNIDKCEKKENTRDSIFNELYELYEAVKKLHLYAIILELFDVIHAVIKHFSISFLPVFIVTNSLFWMLIGLFILPCSLKLGRRKFETGCIRNHNNPSNRNHVCEIKIYYSASVRGANMSKNLVKMTIEFMESYGEVLTKHLGSDDHKVVDMGKTDAEIYEKDIELVHRSNVFVADITSPSHGVGYMISKAVQLKKPVLCLLKKKLDEKPSISAMINGCPDITIKFYNDEFTLKSAIRSFLIDNNFYVKPLKVLLSGPPGAGKSTIAKNISVNYGIQYFSTGEYLRQYCQDARNPLASDIQNLMDKGQLISANIMKEVIKPVLKNSVVLDGYPPSMEDLENMREFDPDFIFVFDVDKKTAIRRQCKRSERKTDKPDMAEERLNVYYKKNPDFLENGDKWFPKSLVIRIDANQTKDQVWEQVNSAIKNLHYPQVQDHSYYPIIPSQYKIDKQSSDKSSSDNSSSEKSSNDETGDVKNNMICGPKKSTRFHFHIDAKDHKSLLKIIQKIYSSYKRSQGQIKVYPVQHLSPGPQIKALNVYKNMMNFHKIDNARDEAFATGFLGDEFDSEFMKNVLNVAHSMKDESYMIELEQYVGQWELDNNNVTVVNNYDECEVDLKLVESKIKLVSNIPKLELHHGFDIPKDGKEMPISLIDLMKECKESGFSNGGWFVFKNNDYWVYRSNEFYDGTVENAKSKLFEQAKSLKNIVVKMGFDVKIMFSLELVHGIWSK